MKRPFPLRITFKTSWVRSALGVLCALFALSIYVLYKPQIQIERLAIRTIPVYAILFLVFSFVKFEARTKRSAFVLEIFCGLLCLLAIVSTSMPSTGALKILIARGALNFLCALIIAVALYAISASWRISVNITVGFVFLLLLADSIIFNLRGTELRLNDLTGWATALNVADQYKFKPYLLLHWLVVSLCLAVFMQFAFPRYKTDRKERLRIRLISTAATVCLALLISWASSGLSVAAWGNYATTVNGYLLNMMIDIRDRNVKKPDGYSSEAVDELSTGYANPGIVQQDQPDIIIIMDETFSDLSIYPNAPKTNISVTPFIDSLQENTIKGYALTSIFGGQTSNAEFELLTGHTMGFLPNGTVPFQQYISSETPSLGWMLKANGYSTFMTHPLYSNGWARDVTYPRLGFDESTFIGDYPREDMIRSYVSDKEVFDHILGRLSDDPDAAPSLTYAITIQNHGGYTYVGDNYTQTIHLEGYNRKYPLAEQYLSLLHETDKAVEYLLTQLQNREKKTIVLFFGDHQAGIEQGFYNELNGSAFDTLEEQMRQYTIPFFIWANYDIEEQTVPITSLGYLPIYLLQAAGIDLPPYYRALDDIRAVIPALNVMGYYSAEHGHYQAFDSAEGAEKAMLERYQYLQYNNLFDTKNRNAIFFGQYLPQ